MISILHRGKLRIILGIYLKYTVNKWQSWAEIQTEVCIVQSYLYYSAELRAELTSYESWSIWGRWTSGLNRRGLRKFSKLGSRFISSNNFSAVPIVYQMPEGDIKVLDNSPSIIVAQKDLKWAFPITYMIQLLSSVFLKFFLLNYILLVNIYWISYISFMILPR